MIFPGTTSLGISRFAGSNASDSARAIRERPNHPERAVVYSGIEASPRPDDQLFPKDETAIGKFDSINPVPPISREQIALSDRFTPRFFQFAHCRRLLGIGFSATQRVDRRTPLTESRWHAR
jgi:hypothetical protein